MQIHDTRQDRINLIHNNKRCGLTKIDEVVLFLLISSFYFRGTKHICMYVHNQNSYCLAVGVVIGEWMAILDILLKRPMAWRSFICSPAAVTILPVTMHTLDEGECIWKEKSGVLRKGIILLAKRNMENVEKKEKGKTTKFLVICS